MKTLLKSIRFFLIFFIFSEAQEMTTTDFGILVENVQKFYYARSIFIVYDRHRFGYGVEHRLLNIIKRHSQRYSMSQAITYDELSRKPSHRENVLYLLAISDTENLQAAINATMNIDMSLHPWLLLFMKNLDFDCNKPGKDFFKLRMDTKMTAKCEENKVLKRYYSVFDNQTEVIDLAEWTPEKKLKFRDSQSLHEVQTNMKGMMLKVARREDSIKEEHRNVAQYLSQLTSELEYIGKFKTEVIVRDASLGKHNIETGEWNGLMKVVHDNEVDIGIYLFSMSNSRLRAVDFAVPITRARYYLFAKLPSAKKVHWDAYFEAFDLYTWTAIGLSITIASILLSLIRNKCENNFLHTFFGHFVNVWGIYCQQGVADPPSNTPIQIIYFSCLISSLVLNAIYSATITSYITLLSPTLPFSTYEEFKLDTSYEVTVTKNTRDEALILGDDRYLAPLKSRLKISCELPIDPDEGFQQACEPKTAFYTDEVQFDGIKYNLPCQLGQLDMNRVEYMSLILPKNSPYTKAISYFMQRLRDHGILNRLINTYFYKYIEIPENHPNIISFEEISPILAVWIFGTVVTLIVWLFELMMFHLLSILHSRAPK